MSKKEIIRIIYLYLAWTGLLLLVSLLADHFLPFRPSYPYAPQLANMAALPRFLYAFAGFDGVHYLTIARQGYLGTGLIQAFFPLYPLLIKLLTLILGNYVWSGLLLSQIFAFSTMLSFYYLVKLLYRQRKIAWWALLALTTFASSFFLRALYNEGLFMTLIFSSLIAFKKQRYWLAGVLGILASATRVTGIFILPTFYLLHYAQERSNWRQYLAKHWRRLLVLACSALGLLAYMVYLYLEFTDPLYFFRVQEQFGAGRSSHLVLLPQVIWRYLKIFWTVPLDWKYFSYVQEFVLSLWALLLLILLTIRTWRRQIKFSAGLLFFAWPSYLLPTLTGNFSSMPRYLLPIFPLFIALALDWQKEPLWRRYAYLLIHLILLIINTLLFVQGYWVA